MAALTNRSRPATSGIHRVGVAERLELGDGVADAGERLKVEMMGPESDPAEIHEPHATQGVLTRNENVF